MNSAFPGTSISRIRETPLSHASFSLAFPIPKRYLIMPKTTMDKYNCFMFWKNKVRFTRQRFVMKFISEAFSEQEFSDKDFRLCVLAPDSWHIIASCFFIMYISHKRHYSLRGADFFFDIFSFILWTKRFFWDEQWVYLD